MTPSHIKHGAVVLSRQNQQTEQNPTKDGECSLLLFKLSDAGLLTVDSLAGIGQNLCLSGSSGDGRHDVMAVVVVWASKDASPCVMPSKASKGLSRCNLNLEQPLSSGTDALRLLAVVETSPSIIKLIVGAHEQVFAGLSKDNLAVVITPAQISTVIRGNKPIDKGSGIGGGKGEHEW